MKKLLVLIFLSGVIHAALSQAIIFCYWTSYASNLSNSDPSLCTHVSYAFENVDSDGVLGSQNLTTFKSLKSLYPDVKFLVSVVGFGASSALQNISDSPILRETFALNCLKYAQDNNLDGIDIDWEFPDNQAENLSLMIESLWNVLHPQGYLLTMAAGSNNARANDRYNVSHISQHVDFINMMTYNYHGSWESQTGIGAPLYSETNTIFTVHRSIQDFLSKIGNNAHKLVMGIPLYGPTWNLTSDETGVGAPGNSSRVSMRYYQICENILNNGWTRMFDDSQKAPYAFGDGVWVGHDDAESIQEKINYVKEFGLGGVFFWEMSMDDSAGNCGEGRYPLMTLVKNALIQTPQETTEGDTTEISSSSSTSTTQRADTTPSNAVRFVLTRSFAVFQLLTILSLKLMKVF